MRRALVTTVLAVVIASGIPASAHHSNSLYFDMARAITIEGEVLRVEWINPHVLLVIQSNNDKGEPETWVIQGSSNVGLVRPRMNERLKPGAPIAARVWPPRNALYVNDAQAVMLARPDNPRRRSQVAHFSKGPRIIAEVEIRTAGVWRTAVQ